MNCSSAVELMVIVSNDDSSWMGGRRVQSLPTNDVIGTEIQPFSIDNCFDDV